jgi:3' terminal RNA ribose 2'-O-methyltransferase Hen1
MLLTLTTTHVPATDLGYLLAKNPARWHEAELNPGRALVFYPEASTTRCTAALLLEIDPIALARGQGTRPDNAAPLEPYVNDRPYVASSFLSVAIARLFGAALKGRSRERPELADTPIPLEAELPVVPARGGEPFLRALFEPLGYSVTCERLPLDPRFPAWGDSRYVSLRLSHTLRLAELLNHLYVLIPVLDDAKHYWVGADELEKLLKAGGDWLAHHPRRADIARRYLRRDRRLVSEALRRLTEEEDPTLEERDSAAGNEEEGLERGLTLNDQRLAAVTAALQTVGAKRVLDLGCGEGRLLKALSAQPWLERISGADVSPRALAIAARRLRLEQLSERARQRFDLFQGSALYRDARFRGHDALTLVEVIEHLDPSRLPTLAQVLFAQTRPPVLILTTPNRDYNTCFPALPAGAFRHRDHRFEWTRAQFADWCGQAAARHGYRVHFAPIGAEHAQFGPPTQMAIFHRDGGPSAQEAAA